LSRKPFAGGIPFYRPPAVADAIYIKQCNKTAKPVRWAYADTTRRIAGSLCKSLG
jgi:hypothetical protein